MNAKIYHLTSACHHSASCARPQTSLLAEITAMMGRLAAGNMLAALLLSAFLITPHVAVAELSTSEEKGISLIIDDTTTLRFASGSFNAETIEGSIKDFTLIIDGEETFRGDRLTLERTHGSDPDIFLIKSLEIDNLRSILPADEGSGFTVSQVRLSNIDVTDAVMLSDDLEDTLNVENALKMASMALYEGPPSLRLRDVKSYSPIHDLSVDLIEFEAKSGFTLDGGYPLFANAIFAFEGGHLKFPTSGTVAPNPGDITQYFPDGLHIEMRMDSEGQQNGKTFDIEGDISVDIAELLRIEYTVEFNISSDLVQRYQALLETLEEAPYDANNFDRNRLLSDMEIVTEAYFVNLFGMTLADQGILDLMFMMSAAQNENLTPTEARIQTASAAPQFVASLPPLNTPENIASIQSFILNGGAVTLEMTPTGNQNVAAILKGFYEGNMPVVIKMQHQP